VSYWGSQLFPAVEYLYIFGAFYEDRMTSRSKLCRCLKKLSWGAQCNLVKYIGELVTRGDPPPWKWIAWKIVLSGKYQTSHTNCLILARKLSLSKSLSKVRLFWREVNRQKLWFCCASYDRSYASNASFNTSQFAEPAKSGFNVKSKSDFKTKIRSTLYAMIKRSTDGLKSSFVNLTSRI
jgi:hypothetical protein